MGKIMNFKEIKSLLADHQNKSVFFHIEEYKIPDHYHVTEVGKEIRTFLDCGGTKRTTEKCVLQLWVANDIEHRVNSNKLFEIINLGNELFEHNIPEVYMEYEKETVSQYSISHFEFNDQEINFYLEKTHTACLAPEKCGVSCCSTPNTLVNLRKKT